MDADRGGADAERRFVRLVSVMRHELVTPLSVIKAYTELLDPERAGEMATPEETAEALAAIRRNVQLALLLVNRLRHADEVLDQGQVELEREDTDLAAVVREIVEDIREILLAEHPVTIDVPDEGVVASVDTARIRQVLFNLLSNAVKYSDAGTRIAVEVTARDDDVVIAVTDGGYGIAPSDVEKAFEPFSRLTDEEKGIGFGLAISRAIVRAHGGDLTVHPAPTGPGSRFALTIPRSGSA